MNRAEVIGKSGFPFFLMRLIVFGLFGAMIGTLFGTNVFLAYMCVLFILYVYFRVKRVEANKRRQRAFMRKKDKKHDVVMECGRWGDFLFVYVFGVYLAADSDNPEEIKHMIYDVVRIIRSVETKGKLPKGRLYSEQVANYVRTLGFDAETCKWACETEVLSDISFLINLGYSREPRSMGEWVSVIQTREKAEGRTVYHSSYIQRVAGRIETLAEEIQIENIRAGGFKAIV